VANSYLSRGSCVAINPYNNRIILSGGTSGGNIAICISKDGGTFWSLKRLSYDGVINTFSFHPENSNIIYAGTSTGKILRTTNGGNSWSVMNKNNFSKIRQISLNPMDPNIIYVASDQGIIKSSDGGLNWSNIYTDFKPFLSIAVDPHQQDRIFAISNSNGVFCSADAGKRWMLINNDLLTFRLTSLAVDSKNSLLYAGTIGNGMFCLDISEEFENVDPPTKYVLSQNYPNPFNAETTIEFEIPESSFYRMKLQIWSNNGKLIKTLSNRTQVFGQYSVNWNGTNDHGLPVASGVYFYVLKSGDIKLTQKMLLVR